MAEACPDQPTGTWDLLRTVLSEGFENIERRLKQLGPVEPDRFSLQEANAIECAGADVSFSSSVDCAKTRSCFA